MYTVADTFVYFDDTMCAKCVRVRDQKLEHTLGIVDKLPDPRTCKPYLLGDHLLAVTTRNRITVVSRDNSTRKRKFDAI